MNLLIYLNTSLNTSLVFYLMNRLGIGNGFDYGTSNVLFVL